MLRALVTTFDTCAALLVRVLYWGRGSREAQHYEEER